MPANGQRFRRLPKPFASVSIITLSLLAWPDPARAYRPFDGTDAAVAKKGEMEIELQPAGRLRDESGTSLIAPATVINYTATIGKPSSKARDRRRFRRRDLQA